MSDRQAEQATQEQVRRGARLHMPGGEFTDVTGGHGGPSRHKCARCGEPIQYQRGADLSCVGAYHYVSLLTGRWQCSGTVGLDSAVWSNGTVAGG